MDRCWKADKLSVVRSDSRKEMGKAAACDAAAVLRGLGREKDIINVIFAAAPSQNEFLEALRQEDVPWEKICAFQMDDYVDLAPEAPQRFSAFLKEHIWDCVPLGQVHILRCYDEESGLLELSRYGRLLREHPLDAAFIGIGENGHIAFNDPDVADFFDPCEIKRIPMDERSRRQQVHDGCFASLDEVPHAALTVTLPVILRAAHIFCVVPAKTKAQAVKAALEGPVGTECPASALRLIDRARLYLDADSAALLKERA